jgi:RHH-type proline utilization regulon transcriptional repressor/proline dehydrogenase/delta 1-pyrroline-5-carboxylate dehydrogenase
MAADDLDGALELQNSTGFGLTAGLESLDPREIRRWLDRVEAGNVYVNRPITGAIVRRQPFGGWKQSSVGPTAKAGGPGYVNALCHWSDTAPDRLGAARTSYAAAWPRLEAGEDPSALRAEINLLRHRPLPSVVLRVEADADPIDVELCLLAASTVGTPVRTSAGDDDLAGALTGTARLRILGTPSTATRRTAHRAGVTVDERRPVADGEIELPRWTHEQALSITAHRYGRPVRRDALGL